MSIGDRIKALREKNKFTQEELAKYIDSTKQTIYKYENNLITNIPSDKIEIIAKVLNTTPAYLMGWDNNSTKLSDNRFMGQNIKKTRLSKGYTLENLSKLTNRDVSYLIKLENGEIEIEIEEIQDIAEALNESVLVLVGWEKKRADGEIREEEKEFAVDAYTRFLSEYLGEDIRKIINYYCLLNTTGQQEATKRVEELTFINKYREGTTSYEENSIYTIMAAEEPIKYKSTDYLELNAARPLKGATEEDIQHDEDIMDDPNF